MKFVPLINPNQIVPGSVLFLKNWTLSKGNLKNFYPILYYMTGKVFVVNVILNHKMNKNSIYTAIYLLYKGKQYFTFISNDKEFDGELEIANI